MTPAPIVASLAEQPAYYALYALYADYARNNAFHSERESFARLRDAIRYIQPLTGLVQPDEKSWSLRLFTERESLARFSPEVASAAWRMVQQVVEEIGPPRESRRARAPINRSVLRVPARAVRRTDAPPASSAAEPRFPRSPVDYRMAV